MSRCRECGKEITWAVLTESGRKMPVDSMPDNERGNIRLVANSATVLTRAERDAHLERGGKLYVSHFATCTQPGKFRKTKAQRHLQGVMDGLGKR